MVATSWNAYKMCENTRFVFLVLSPYSHAYPLSQKYTASVWFSRVFKLSLSGVSACVHVYAQNIAFNTKEKPLKFQSRGGGKFLNFWPEKVYEPCSLLLMETVLLLTISTIVTKNNIWELQFQLFFNWLSYWKVFLSGEIL